VDESKEHYPEDGARKRRQRLLSEIFRNALALALLKQAVVGGTSMQHQQDGTTPDGTDGSKIPPYLQG
jgi:hypothetical protein